MCLLDQIRVLPSCRTMRFDAGTGLRAAPDGNREDSKGAGMLNIIITMIIIILVIIIIIVINNSMVIIIVIIIIISVLLVHNVIYCNV